jgi:hypothetical protein
MANLVNVANVKTYTIPGNTTRTFHVKASTAEVGKMRWLKVTGHADINLIITYMTSTVGDTDFEIRAELSLTTPYEFGFEPWEDAAESTLKGMMVDEDDYIKVELKNTDGSAHDAVVYYFLLNAGFSEV